MLKAKLVPLLYSCHTITGNRAVWVPCFFLLATFIGYIICWHHRQSIVYATVKTTYICIGIKLYYRPLVQRNRKVTLNQNIEIIMPNNISQQIESSLNKIENEDFWSVWFRSTAGTTKEWVGSSLTG